MSGHAGNIALKLLINLRLSGEIMNLDQPKQILLESAPLSETKVTRLLAFLMSHKSHGCLLRKS